MSIRARLCLILALHEIVNALFGYGSFNEEDIKMTALALMYFGYGIPAFALVKIFSNFFFARNNTKTPFYISSLIVLFNIVISVSFFSKVGFIIIPIATTISSWFNALLLFIFLKNRVLFYFNNIFIIRFIKILTTSLLMGILFNFLITYFQEELAFNQNIKSFYLILFVVLSLLFYLFVLYIIRSFTMIEFNLKY